ncbi:MAG: C69 family dipeptidase, partial [Candidatus Caldatribacteriota bacterium]|nr:C69 family dipeptidase [Candidatus Caldatribacteriota bacterium]
MCDTIVALNSATKDGTTLFGKNSDREPDEVQNIVIFPQQKHSSKETVKCAYLTIPQVSETARIFLCQPFWMFGAEMGANEYGVVIGNEAIFTKEKPDKTGLTGMDLIRLALERSVNAKQALEIIINLLETYGQGGNCGYRYPLKYMNSFLIADPKEAYVLETVKSWWIWKKITDIWSISNLISIQKDYDACSEGLIENAVNKGYCSNKKDFNFRKCYSAKFMTWGAKGAEREKRSKFLLLQQKEKLTTYSFLNILRDHGSNPQWSPDKGPSATLCLHAANTLFRRSQTVCSMVAKLGKDKQFFYTTGASNPCMSPFFPVFSPESEIPGKYAEGKASYCRESYWWECERFHRKTLKNMNAAILKIQPLIIDYEKNMISFVEENLSRLTQKAIDKYFTQAQNLIKN